MKITPSLVAAAVAVVAASASACSHGSRGLEASPTALAAVQADLRLVGGETTWVAHGQSYQLVGRTKADIVAVQTLLDREATAIHRVFPSDTLAPLVVIVRRAVPEGTPYVTAAPVPNTIRGTVVEVVLPTPKMLADQEKLRGSLPGVRPPTLPAVRAWLSAHASQVTQVQARPSEADGEFEDPRIPAWAQEMIPSLASDSLFGKFTTLLAARPDNLIPVSRYFTMERAPMATLAGQRAEGAPAGARDGGGAGTQRGGMSGGGRGGMGGGRGGMGGGRGGMGGGGTGRGQADGGAAGLQGSPLFEAQSFVLGRYLVARDGYALIGEILDGQILRRPIDEALKRRNTIDFAHMDLDWLQWLLDKAGTSSR